MKPIDILAKFFDIFTCYMRRVRYWEPRGVNCIEVTLDDSSVLRFTYTDDKNWRLETV